MPERLEGELVILQGGSRHRAVYWQDDWDAQGDHGRYVDTGEYRTVGSIFSAFGKVSAAMTRVLMDRPARVWRHVDYSPPPPVDSPRIVH